MFKKVLSSIIIIASLSSLAFFFTDQDSISIAKRGKDDYIEWNGGERGRDDYIEWNGGERGRQLT